MAGLPPGLLQVLPGGGEIGEALIAADDVRVISFTGSTAVGRRVGELAGRQLKRAHLELGGNSALVVLPDADVDKAVTLAAFGSFFHQGEICMTTGRHLVHRAIYDEFVDKLAARAAKLPVGDPFREQVALGPIIDESQRDKVDHLVRASQTGGGRVVAGGEYDRLFYQATVLADMPLDAPAFAEEVFGPVAPVTAYTTEDEALSIAGDTRYALSLGIVTPDVMRGLALAEKIPSGIVHINDQTVNDEANAPFGGVGVSGTGVRFGGAAANIEAFTETQWVTVRATPPPYPF
jgi:benzaldehyde dehydrogenase (NAD)